MKIMIEKINIKRSLIPKIKKKGNNLIISKADAIQIGNVIKSDGNTKIFKTKKEIEKAFFDFLKEYNDQKSIVKLFKKKQFVEIYGKDNLEGDLEFDIKYEFQDDFINLEPYKSGSAILYLNKHFYNTINEIAIKYFGKPINWLNDTHGQIIIKQYNI